MLKPAAVIFGLMLVVIGILGFVPVVTIPATDGDYHLLLGAFPVDALHNFAHILTGVAALIVGVLSEAVSRMYFRIIGVIYAVLGLAGLAVAAVEWLGTAHYFSNAFLHLAIAIVALSIGFALEPQRKRAPPRHPA